MTWLIVYSQFEWCLLLFLFYRNANRMDSDQTPHSAGKTCLARRYASMYVLKATDDPQRDHFAASDPSCPI